MLAKIGTLSSLLDTSVISALRKGGSALTGT
jgi:hypothetical protein